MRYRSVCSGIEGATVAWEPLGFTPVSFAEIDPFCSALLAHHYPNVPNVGDFTKDNSNEPADILVGGTPCQDFSVAGLRAGMAGDRGNLTLEFIGIAKRTRPRWLVWENVPGILSSNGGRDFGAFLGGLAQLGYGFAYRILDAQYFGVPQRRRRVFVVGHPGDWRRAAAVLFERHSLQGHPAPRGKTGQGIACDVAPGLTGSGRGVERAGESRGQDPVIACYGVDAQCNAIPDMYGSLNRGGGIGGQYNSVAYSVTSKWAKGSGGPAGDECQNLVTHSLRANGFDASEDGTGRGTPLISFTQNQCGDVLAGGICAAMSTNQNAGGRNTPKVLQNMTVRRLTPRECERLQGFPDVVNSCTIRVCGDHQKNSVLAEMQSRKSQSSVGSVERSQSGNSVLSADQPSPVNHPRSSERAAVNVEIDCEAGTISITTRERGLFASAIIAESGAKTFLATPIADSALLIVAMLSWSAQIARHGKAEAQPRSKNSLLQENGNTVVLVSGREIEHAAKDVARNIRSLRDSLRFTISEPGLSSLNSGLNLQTLSCSVVNAMSSFIPGEIKDASAYDLRLRMIRPYTLIPYRGKPAADGPRYKALGNSWAVPVVRWIGERIQAVDKR